MKRPFDSPRRIAVLVLRWLALVALAVWFGGFTFYASVVVPVLGDVLGSFDAGASVTRVVTVFLNWIGVATLAAWWVLAVVERSSGGRWWRRGWWGLLLADSLTLALLFAMHAALAGRLDDERMTGFYRLHERYLIVSTVQWGVNLALLAVSLVLWQTPGDPESDRPAEAARIEATAAGRS